MPYSSLPANNSHFARNQMLVCLTTYSSLIDGVKTGVKVGGGVGVGGRREGKYEHTEGTQQIVHLSI